MGLPGFSHGQASSIIARRAYVLLAVLALLSPTIFVAWSWNCGAWCGDAPASPVEAMEQSVAAWNTIEAVKTKLPKASAYQVMTDQQLKRAMPVWVISLKRAEERRQAMVRVLKGVGISNYELVDAVDGRNSSAVTYEEARAYFKGPRLRLWQKGHRFWRGKLAADLSHYHLLQRVIATNTTAVIMEDDAKPISHSGSWYTDLRTALKELPDDWQVLYLAACYHEVGKAVGPHVVVLRSGACIIGYVATPSFARAALAEAHKLREHVSDLTWSNMMIQHRLQAYLAEPSLVGWQDFKTLQGQEQAPADITLSLWDKLSLRLMGERTDPKY